MNKSNESHLNFLEQLSKQNSFQTPSDEPIKWFYYVEASIGSVSVLGSFFIIFVFIFYKKIRSFPFELVLYLTIASMLNTISYLIYYREQENMIDSNMLFCKTQSFIMIWFELSQMIWVNIITYSAYENLVEVDEEYLTSAKRIKYLFIGYILPLVYPIVGLSSNWLGRSGRWCWITQSESFTSTWFYTWTVYSTIWLLILLNIFFTVLIIKYLNKISAISRVEKEKISKFIFKLIQYPAIQIICILPATINRLVYEFYGEYNSYVEFVCLIFISIQGICYAICYGYNPQVRTALIQSFTKCCKKNSLDESSDSDAEISKDLFKHSFLSTVSNDNDISATFNSEGVSQRGNLNRNNESRSKLIDLD